MPSAAAGNIRLEVGPTGATDVFDKPITSGSNSTNLPYSGSNSAARGMVMRKVSRTRGYSVPKPGFPYRRRRQRLNDLHRQIIKTAWAGVDDVRGGQGRHRVRCVPSARLVIFVSCVLAHRHRPTGGRGMNLWECPIARFAIHLTRRKTLVNRIVYIVGAVVIIIAVLSFLGLR